MLKYFFPALIGLAVFSGLLLLVTPFVADQFFPVNAESYRQADQNEVHKALADWFQVSLTDVQRVQGVQYLSATQKKAWFTFSANRTVVENFIRQLRLQQKTLSPSVLQNTFMAQIPSVDWWQPEALQRETYFTSEVNQQHIYLLYHAERQQGYLLIITERQPTHF